MKNRKPQLKKAENEEEAKQPFQVKTLSLKKCESALNGFGYLNKQFTFKAIIAFKINRVFKKLKSIKTDIDEQKKATAQKFNLNEEDLIKPSPELLKSEAYKTYEAEIEGLMKSEHDIHGLPEIKLEDLENKEVIPELFDLIEDFITE